MAARGISARLRAPQDQLLKSYDDSGSVGIFLNLFKIRNNKQPA
jgi:hypothetical protein